MVLKTELKNLLEKYKIKPNKRLGQNFLIDQNVLKKIVEAAKISPEETILEIGPGLGVLTKELAKKAKKVIAVEKDADLAKILKEILKDCENVEIIQGDILKLSAVCRLPFADYKVVANIPYYLTSPLIRKFLESENPPREMILTIQKEVAQRICAAPPKMNLLAIAVQFYSRPEIIKYVSKKSFWPTPKVDSAIIKIVPHCHCERLEGAKQSLKDYSVAVAPRNDRMSFFKIVKAGFCSPRKQLVNNLSDKLGTDKEKIKRTLIECGFGIQIRAQNLSVKDWTCLRLAMLAQAIKIP